MIMVNLKLKLICNIDQKYKKNIIYKIVLSLKKTSQKIRDCDIPYLNI